MKVGERIQSIREEKDLTRKQLSQKTGINLERVKDIELSFKMPENFELVRICEVLEVPVPFMIYGGNEGSTELEKPKYTRPDDIELIRMINSCTELLMPSSLSNEESLDNHVKFVESYLNKIKR